VSRERFDRVERLRVADAREALSNPALMRGALFARFRNG
jgi:hypothetical protein